MIVPDATLELSIEQLVGALNKKLFMECAQVQSAMPPMSRALVATLMKYTLRNREETSDVNDLFRRSMLLRNEPETSYTK